MRRFAKTSPAIAMGALAALACLAPPAQAAEIVTLRNGFQMRCDHHAETDGEMRLYMSAGQDNYIELPPAQISSVAQAIDLQPPQTPSASQDAATLRRSGSLSATAAPLSRADLSQMLASAGRRHNLDVDLLASVVSAESGGNPRAVSRAGARGLMQLMPSTAAGLGVSDSFQPQQNVSGGSAYLDALLTRYNNNLALALAAYNAGPQAVDRYHGIPPYPETRLYVARVIHQFNRRVLARAAAARRAESSQIDPRRADSR